MFAREAAIQQLAQALHGKSFLNDPASSSSTQAFTSHATNQLPQHFISNEVGLADSLKKLETTPSLKQANKINIGIMVGEAHFISRLPQLKKHVDLLILIDIQSPILESNQFALKILKDNPQLQGFINNIANPAHHPILNKTYRKNGLETAIAPVSVPAQYYQNIERNAGVYFIESQESYAECRQAANEITITTLLFDILDINMASQLKQLLNAFPHEITYCHISNVPDYDTDSKPLRDIVAAPIVPGSDNEFVDRFRVKEVLDVLLSDSKKYLISYSQFVPTEIPHLLQLYTTSSIQQYVSQRQDFLTDIARLIYPWKFSHPSPVLISAANTSHTWQPAAAPVGTLIWINSEDNAFIKGLHLHLDQDDLQIDIMFHDLTRMSRTPQFFKNITPMGVLKTLQAMLFQQKVPQKLLADQTEQKLQNKTLRFLCDKPSLEYSITFLTILNSLSSLPKELMPAIQSYINQKGSSAHAANPSSFNPQ